MTTPSSVGWSHICLNKWDLKKTRLIPTIGFVMLKSSVPIFFQIHHNHVENRFLRYLSWYVIFKLRKNIYNRSLHGRFIKSNSFPIWSKSCDIQKQVSRDNFFLFVTIKFMNNELFFTLWTAYKGNWKCSWNRVGAKKPRSKETCWWQTQTRTGWPRQAAQNGPTFPHSLKFCMESEENMCDSCDHAC